jgi:hypothetical protein
MATLPKKDKRATEMHGERGSLCRGGHRMDTLPTGDIRAMDRQFLKCVVGSLGFLLSSFLSYMN